MHRHLMNLLPTLLAGAPVLFALGMLVLALTTTLPHLISARVVGAGGRRR